MGKTKKSPLQSGQTYEEIITKFKRTMKKLRKLIADHFAERYSSECQIQ